MTLSAAAQVVLKAKKCFNKPVSYVAVDYDNEYKKSVVSLLLSLLPSLSLSLLPYLLVFCCVWRLSSRPLHAHYFFC